MHKKTHLTLLTGGRGSSEGDNEVNRYYDVKGILSAVDEIGSPIDYDAMLKACVTLSSEYPGHDYWEFTDADIEYFDFLLKEIPQNDNIESNLVKANFFIQLVYLSFLTRMGGAKYVQGSIAPYFKSLPANLQKMIEHHSLMLSTTKKRAEQELLVSGDTLRLRETYSDRTSDLLGS